MDIYKHRHDVKIKLKINALTTIGPMHALSLLIIYAQGSPKTLILISTAEMLWTETLFCKIQDESNFSLIDSYSHATSRLAKS